MRDRSILFVPESSAHAQRVKEGVRRTTLPYQRCLHGRVALSWAPIRCWRSHTSFYSLPQPVLAAARTSQRGDRSIPFCLRLDTWLPSGSVRQQHGGAQELAAPTVVPPRWAHVPGAGPRSRSGRPWIVEPAALGCLPGPPGPTAELGGLWGFCGSSRVRV